MADINEGDKMQTLIYITPAVLAVWMIAMLIAEPPCERRKRIEDEIRENRARRRWGRL